MAEPKYDIFISYRRDGGAQYARILQLMLIQRGYRVFLDYDELTDGIFSDNIKAAIREAPVFMLILSKGSMARCVNDDDWVRQEMILAVEQGKHIIPVNPDNSFDSFPEGIPEKLKDTFSTLQYSEISFGQALGVTVDLMIEKRLAPTLGKRTTQGHKDDNYGTALETLRRNEAHNRFMKRLAISGVIAVIVIVIATCLWFWHHNKVKETQSDMRAELNEKFQDFFLQLSPDLTVEQMAIIDTMLTNMTEVYPDSVWMSQFEFTTGQWHGIKGEPYDEALAHMPMTGVSFADISMFLIDLGDMTNLQILLPDADLWEYAARGGEGGENATYAGGDDPEAVAWFAANSGGHPHPADGQQGKEPNMLDLFDMSGNVAELCNSMIGDKGEYVVCGGDFSSPSTDITVTSHRTLPPDKKDDKVGFRIVIKKDHADND